MSPRFLRAITTLMLALALGPVTARALEPDHRVWIESMKSAERGPFARIRWFCKDGTVLPPEPYACREHGGGAQHGEWSERTLALRAAGYLIATFYADLDVPALLASPSLRDDLAQMLVEQFLIRVDDGWILRRARFYRGAFQSEGEQAGARRLLLALASREEWLGTRFLPLRTMAATLPHGRETATAQRIRQLAMSLSERDPGFETLRNKIHSLPTRTDADLVRNYAAGIDDAALAAELELLADEIVRLHETDSGAALAELLRRMPAPAPATARLKQLAQAAAIDGDAVAHFAASARLLGELRDLLPAQATPEARLRMLDVSIMIEAELYAVSTSLRGLIPELTRRQRIALLEDSVAALYGSGLLSARQREALHDALGRLGDARPDLDAYRRDIRYLALAIDWAARQLRFHFGTGMEKLAELEPQALLFDQDLLRGGPLLLYSAIVDGLVRDANRLAGVRSQVFGRETGTGIRAVNPGLARGILRDGRNPGATALQRDGIYLLPETRTELTPVAGIITAGEGNALSHVQILARSLGIPNAAVETSLLQALLPHADRPVLLAISPGGTVVLRDDTGDVAPAAHTQTAAEAPMIEIDTAKLDLAFRELVDLARLRAADSGRIVGPKAAKLGELKRLFPGQVADGIAIPFGVFRALLDRPGPDGVTPMHAWMAQGYRRIESLPAGSAAQAGEREQLRQAVFDWISAAQPDAGFVQTLRRRMEQRFGADGSYGVYVRSDTNVEDLPGFTGAGLNLTVPNVIGVDNVVEAIRRVWASPFTPRAFAWRQSRMTTPEQVYPAILLLEAMDVEKSGVLVTADPGTGDTDWLSVAVNEGVGGAVDNQAAESLRVHRSTGEVRLLSQASAPFRRRLSATGGLATLPASGTDAVLGSEEVETLRQFSENLAARFPGIVNAAGQPVPADVEFGFLGSRLVLFQVRPFLENPAAANNAYLRSLDPDAARLRGTTVDMDAVPD